MTTSHRSQETPTTPLLSTKEAARRLGLSVSFLNRHRHQLPGRYRAGRVYRWSLDELRRWMGERAQKGDD